MALTLQHIFQQHFDDFAERHPLAPYQYRAGCKIRDCRTRAMGGHLLSCPHGHVHRIQYHSCYHRSCPQCAELDRERWLATWKARLLECGHMHCIFTTPHDLIPLWRYNKSLFGSLLFRAATSALAELLGDEKYLGAVAGMLAALHTWGKMLIIHPHLHVIVTFGGLAADGTWRTPKKSCLLPRKVLMQVFRRNFRRLLLSALDKGELVLPPNTTPTAVRNLMNKLGRVDWNVKLLEKYEHGRGVLMYLARYLKGGPIGNERLLDYRNGKIRFSYRDHRDLDEATGRGRRKVACLDVDEFLSRLLEHVPPPNMQTVRGYGLYANSKRAELSVARQHFGQSAELPEVEPVTWRDLCERAGRDHQTVCPVCGAALVQHTPFNAARGPPAWLADQAAAPRAG